jgi:hypothetical protein
MSLVETSEKQPLRKASSTTLSSSTTTTRGAWSWRRLSTFY